MEPFEWLILGTGFAVGMVFGPRRKSVVRSAAKGYMALEEKARTLRANLREGFRDAVAEAQYEHEHGSDLTNGDGSRPALAGTKHTKQGPENAPRSRPHPATTRKQTVSVG